MQELSRLGFMSLANEHAEKKYDQDLQNRLDYLVCVTQNELLRP